MDEWMNEWINKQMSEWMSEWMNELNDQYSIWFIRFKKSITKLPKIFFCKKNYGGGG